MNFINFYFFLQNKYYIYFKKILKKKKIFNIIFFFLIFLFYNFCWCKKNYFEQKFSYLLLSKFEKNEILKKKLSANVFKTNIPIKYYNINKRIHIISKKRKKINLIIRLRRKNLFLTLLNNEGNIISKTNIGSCGFKKRVKFTGFALQNTMNTFAEKIIKTIQDDWINKINIIWMKYVNLKAKDSQKFFKAKKKYKKIKRRKFLWFLYKKKKKKKYLAKKKKILKKLKIKKKRIIKKFNLHNKWSSITKYQKNKKRYMYIIKFSEKKKFFLKLLYYRHYKLYRLHYLEFLKKKILKHYLFLDLVLKNNIKFWAFRYIFKGFRKLKLKLKFMQVHNKKPAIHSKGFRLKKKRRL